MGSAFVSPALLDLMFGRAWICLVQGPAWSMNTPTAIPHHWWPVRTTRAYIYLYIFFPFLFFNVLVGQLFCNVLGELLLSVYVKCHMHVGCVTVLKYDMPYILQVNKYAFSGGQDSMENHRKFGANLKVAVQFSLR